MRSDREKRIGQEKACKHDKKKSLSKHLTLPPPALSASSCIPPPFIISGKHVQRRRLPHPNKTINPPWVSSTKSCQLSPPGSCCFIYRYHRPAILKASGLIASIYRNLLKMRPCGGSHQFLLIVRSVFLMSLIILAYKA